MACIAVYCSHELFPIPGIHSMPALDISRYGMAYTKVICIVLVDCVKCLEVKRRHFFTSCVHGLTFTMYIMKKHAFLEVPPDKPF